MENTVSNSTTSPLKQTPLKAPPLLDLFWKGGRGKMEAPMGFLSLLWNLLVFLPFFFLLLVLGIVKAILVGPVVFVIILAGNSAIIVGLWPCHVIWTYYCVFRTKMFGPMLKCLMLISLVTPFVLWPIVGILGSLFAGLGYGLVSPLMATFEAVAEGVPNKFLRCFVDGTWSSVLGGCTIVRDFADVCFHSYFSVMDGLLESKPEKVTEIRLWQLPGCILAGIFGVLINVPVTSAIVIYKAPIMLLKGWQRLIHDLIGREGPFLETVCVPFAGLSILLWPAVVVFATLMGIISSFFLGCYAAAVSYQESSIKRGFQYAIAAISMFDEYTNDFLYLREGSCFPRPRYRKAVLSSPSSFPRKQLPEQSELTHLKRRPIKTPSMKMQELKAVVIWDNFFKGSEATGKELIGNGAILLSDLESWQNPKKKIVKIGLPAYVFLQCFLRSIRSNSTGFLMRDNIELNSVNRPEGRLFDWFFEPMTIMKEQIKAANLEETEELYLNKLTLCSGDVERIKAWQNGGMPPVDEVRRAQLEGISRRLQGFGLNVSRAPTFQRRFHLVVKALLQEAQQRSQEHNDRGTEENI